MSQKAAEPIYYVMRFLSLSNRLHKIKWFKKLQFQDANLWEVLQFKPRQNGKEHQESFIEALIHLRKNFRRGGVLSKNVSQSWLEGNSAQRTARQPMLTNVPPITKATTQRLIHFPSPVSRLNSFQYLYPILLQRFKANNNM